MTVEPHEEDTTNTRTLDAAWHAAEAIRDRFAELNGPLSRDSHHDALVILESLAALRALPCSLPPVSSAENDTRPVWLTREDFTNKSAGQIARIAREKWDAAPADPAEAVRQAFISHEINSDYHGDVVGVEAVLAALGAPKATDGQ